MKYFLPVRCGLSLLILSFLFLFFSCEVVSAPDQDDDNTDEYLSSKMYIMTLPFENLSEDEINSLLYMREEEKLARDVYQYLFDVHGMQIFDNIAQSEQRHMDALLNLIEKYELQDPVGDAEAGVFQNEDLQSLYQSLTKTGKVSQEQALNVGATIEDLDIFDLDNALNNLVDNQDFIKVYSNLNRGSRNHLRAFVSNLEKRGVSYSPSYISEERFQSIITTTKEKGGKGNCKGKGQQK